LGHFVEKYTVVGFQKERITNEVGTVSTPHGAAPGEDVVVTGVVPTPASEQRFYLYRTHPHTVGYFPVSTFQKNGKGRGCG
jgi:hypothetical protein